MNRFTLCQYLLLLMYADSIYCQAHYYITSSQNGPCVQNTSCLTLSQFAASPLNIANASIFFLPGNHTLDRVLSLTRGNNFTITKYGTDSGTVFVNCVGQGMFHIRESVLISIRNLHFIGCGGNTITQVEQLLIEESTFQNVINSGSALVLNQVSAARLIRSSFVSNKLPISRAYNYANLVDLLFMMSNDFVNFVYFNRRPSLPVWSGGALYLAFSNISIIDSNFVNNRAEQGGVIAAHASNLYIANSYFGHNNASFGGVINATLSQIDIHNSTFSENFAETAGGTMMVYACSCTIQSSNFTRNRAFIGGAVIAYVSICDVAESIFNGNMALSPPYDNYVRVEAVIFIINSHFCVHNTIWNGYGVSGNSLFVTWSESSVNINNSLFTHHNGHEGAVVLLQDETSISIVNSTFIDNTAVRGGVIMVQWSHSPIIIINSTITNNSATQQGGAIYITLESSVNISSSTFTNNIAQYGGAIWTDFTVSVNIINGTFTNNSATIGGGAIRAEGSLSVDNSMFEFNAATKYGGSLLISNCSANISDSEFHQNVRSLYAFNSELILSGSTIFRSSVEPPFTFETPPPVSDDAFVEIDLRQFEEGGAITSFQSTVNFAGVTNLFNNQASDGGAMLATESRILISGITTVANNRATGSNGGGIYLLGTTLEIGSKCNISQNIAQRGGGIYAISSIIAVNLPGTLYLLHNSAVYGSGIYLQANSKLNILKSYGSNGNYLNFIGNHAMYGGGLYVDDHSNSGACLPSFECFFQILALHQRTIQIHNNHINPIANLYFSKNNASKSGSDIFGGLLDRCVPSTFAEVYLMQNVLFSGFNYLRNVSNIASHSMASHPVRLCFCTDKAQLDCSYQHPPIIVKKGERFTLSVAAVDHVNHSVDANIIASLTSFDGGLGEGQQTQTVQQKCTDLEYSVFSPLQYETLNLFADGPCDSATLSTSKVTIEFEYCTCPLGFEPISNDINATNCVCDCDPKLLPHITQCNSNTSSILRVNTNSWITYVNHTDPPGYVIHPTCPSDYCRPSSEATSINLNHPNGADHQCSNNHRGILCGACQYNLSLSLGSSLCLPCHNYWPAVFVVILMAAIVAGILLVISMLALNITVTVGLINGFIFYANIIAAGNSVFFPSSEPSFPTVFVAWLNLDIGIDVCFIDGLDVYTKTWLQLAFPAYIIFLVVMVIVFSDCSTKFAALIGKRDPVATLATLILLSYAKLLSTTITALSFTTLRYPDGSLDYVWLADGNVKYFQGKHIPLGIVAIIIVLIGLPYTILLLFWQWIVRAPQWKILSWTRNTKLNALIDKYHVPYNKEYRYWTGLLLVVRVVLFITASITVSSTPQTLPLITGILIGVILLLKGIIGLRAYKESLVDMMDTTLYFNVHAFTILSQYNFKTDVTKQTAVAYASTIGTCLLFISSIVYHVAILFKKGKSTDELSMDEHPSVPTKDHVTGTVIEIHKSDPFPQEEVTGTVIELNKSDPFPQEVTGTVIEFHKSDPFPQEEQSDAGDEQEAAQSDIHKCQSGTPQND